MTNGFKKSLLKILCKFYLRTTGAKGLVLTGGRGVYNFLKSEEFDVEYGEGTLSDYAFIYIPSAVMDKNSIEKYLTKLEKCGIIVFSRITRQTRELVIIQKRKDWIEDGS